jgi:hypothetical protein
MREPGVGRPRRLIAAAPGALLALAGALVLMLLVVSPPQDTGTFLFGVLVFALPSLMLGLGLLHFGWPSLLPQVKTRLVRLGRLDVWRHALRQTARAFAPAKLSASPLRRAALALSIAILGYYLAPRGARSVGVFAAITAYSIADPVINTLRSHWWVNAIKSLAGFIVLFIASGLIADADRIGEAGMIFMLPLMIYPVALGLSGLIRFIWFYLPPA